MKVASKRANASPSKTRTIHGAIEQLALLVEGYKQSSASPEIVNGVEDRLLEQYPKSEEACGILLA